MRLYMQEKVFSWRDRFKVWDEEQNEKYYVEGELFSWGKRLHVYDAQGREAAFAMARSALAWVDDPTPARTALDQISTELAHAQEPTSRPQPRPVHTRRGLTPSNAATAVD